MSLSTKQVWIHGTHLKRSNSKLWWTAAVTLRGYPLGSLGSVHAFLLATTCPRVKLGWCNWPVLGDSSSPEFLPLRIPDVLSRCVFIMAGAMGIEGPSAAFLLSPGPHSEIAHVSPWAVKTRTALSTAKCALGRGKIAVSWKTLF